MWISAYLDWESLIQVQPTVVGYGQNAILICWSKAVLYFNALSCAKLWEHTPPATPAYNLVMTAHRIIAAHVLKFWTSEYLLLETWTSQYLLLLIGTPTGDNFCLSGLYAWEPCALAAGWAASHTNGGAGDKAVLNSEWASWRAIAFKSAWHPSQDTGSARPWTLCRRKDSCHR